MRIFDIDLDMNIMDKIKNMPVVHKGLFSASFTTPPPINDIDIAEDAIYINIDAGLKNYISESLYKSIYNKDIKYSNCIGYPPNGGMGWHTNSNSPGIRIYASWSETGDSGMIWYQNNHIIVDSDSPGLNIRQFRTPCWHGVWSNCYRYSLGFRLLS